jgi:hypothetical protein
MIILMYVCVGTPCVFVVGMGVGKKRANHGFVANKKKQKSKSGFFCPFFFLFGLAARPQTLWHPSKKH